MLSLRLRIESRALPSNMKCVLCPGAAVESSERRLSPQQQIQVLADLEDGAWYRKAGEVGGVECILTRSLQQECAGDAALSAWWNSGSKPVWTPLALFSFRIPFRVTCGFQNLPWLLLALLTTQMTVCVLGTPSAWDSCSGFLMVHRLSGWCLGRRPQTPSAFIALMSPVNADSMMSLMVSPLSTWVSRACQMPQL